MRCWRRNKIGVAGRRYYPALRFNSFAPEPWLYAADKAALQRFEQFGFDDVVLALARRGLRAVKLVIADAHDGLKLAYPVNADTH
jgi:hypothetical protein